MGSVEAQVKWLIANSEWKMEQLEINSCSIFNFQFSIFPKLLVTSPNYATALIILPSGRR